MRDALRVARRLCRDSRRARGVGEHGSRAEIRGLHLEEAPREAGEVAFTASGKRGGGAYAVGAKPGAKVDLVWPLAILNSAAAWERIERVGDRKKSGKDA